MAAVCQGGTDAIVPRLVDSVRKLRSRLAAGRWRRGTWLFLHGSNGTRLLVVLVEASATLTRTEMLDMHTYRLGASQETLVQVIALSGK